MAKYYNFTEANRGDPFLISASVQPKSNLAVGGGGIRALQKKSNSKILLPLKDMLINKAKACEEMIMYEKGDKFIILNSEKEINNILDSILRKALQKLPNYGNQGGDNPYLSN